MNVANLATAAVTTSDLSPIIDSLESQISVGNIIGILAIGLGVAVVLGFMWWGGRKLVGMIMQAFKKGKVKL